MTFEQFWGVIAPYAQGFVGMTIAGIPIGAILWAILKKLVTKTVTKLLANTSAENLSKEIASKLANSSINVDLTAVTEKQLSAIKVEVTEQLSAVAKTLDAYTANQVLMLKALSASEVVSDETRAEMIAVVDGAGQHAEDAKKATISIALKPVEDEVKQETATVLSFGG